MVRTGSSQRPYTAPIYTSYQSVFQSLKSQGWKAFYKGLGFRSLHQTIHSMMFFYTFGEHGPASKNFSGLSLLYMYGLLTFYDFAANTFQVL